MTCHDIIVCVCVCIITDRVTVAGKEWREEERKRHILGTALPSPGCIVIR